MATLNLKSIATLVSNQAAAVQASATALVDFSVGSILLAAAEANAAVAVWLQGLVLVVLALSRLVTSFGSDVDTFVNDYGVFRLSASGSAGTVTFSRADATQSAFIVPTATQVRSADGTQVFAVTIDVTNTFWNTSLGGYLVPAGISAITVPVASLTTGAVTNVVAGGVNTLLTPISGIDYVSNNISLAGGTNGETDSALKTRFVLFFLGLSKGNVFGVEFALASLNVGVAYQIVDSYTYGGVFTPGFFYVVVDDGSGSPSPSFLAAASTAVNSVKPLGVQFSVFSPRLITVGASLIVTILPNFVAQTVVGNVKTTITTNLTALGLGGGTGPYQIAEWAQAVPGVAPNGVSALLVNGLSGDAADIAPNQQNRLMPGIIVVSPIGGALIGPTPPPVSGGGTPNTLGANTILSGSGLYVVTTPGITITLPLWSADLSITIKDQTGSATPNITILAQGGSTIDGTSSVVIVSMNESLTFVPTGTNQFVIS